MLFGLFEFCGCVPAYLVPAMPPVLKAEPGAVDALPGVEGVVSQLQLGWPLVTPVWGSAAKAEAEIRSGNATAQVRYFSI